MKRFRFRRPKGLQGWLLVLFAMALGIYAGLYCTAWFMQFQVQEALSENDEELASRWMTRAHWFPLRRARTHFLEARMARHRGEHAGMELQLQQAGELGYDPELLLREQWLARAEMGDMDLLTNQMALLLTDSRGDELEIVLSYVKGLVRNQRYEAARQMLDAWIKDYPDAPYPMQMLGSVLMEMDRLDEAEKIFIQVLRLEPGNGQAAFGLGTILMTLQKTSRALAYLEIAARDEMLHDEAMIAQAHCHRGMDNPERARQILEKLALQSSDRTVIVELAQLNLDQGKFQVAAERVKSLVEENPNEVDARYIYAQALRQLDRQDEAEGHFAAVMEINRHLALANKLAEQIKDGPESLEQRIEIARIQMQYGSEQEGLRWLVGAFQIKNSHRPTLEALYQYYAGKADDNPDERNFQLRRDEFQERLKQPAP
jgi:thioredoxin-like negative regulator of GroEL